METIEIQYRDTIETVERGTTAAQLAARWLPDPPHPVVAARVNNRLRTLNDPLQEGGAIEFLDTASSIGHRMVERTLVFLLNRALRDLYPDAILKAEYSVSNGIYCQLREFGHLKTEHVEALAARMEELIASDLPLERRLMSREDAIRIFRESGNRVRADLFEHNRSKTRTAVYTLGGYHDYLYGYLVPRTGMAGPFALRYYMPGFLLLMPRRQEPRRMPPFQEQPKLFAIHRETDRWNRLQNMGNVNSLNRAIREGRIGELIRVAEGMHEKKILHIAEQITGDREGAKLIMIAGPSSSGKTTFARRLAVQLRVNGIEPVSISLDDYFVPRDQTPLDADGKPDFEALEAIDLPRFNADLSALLQGEEVELPRFDFVRGSSQPSGRILRVAPDQPLIIEGIHGLNDRLTAAIPRSSKFYIYISALTQLNLDCSSRIKTTDARLMRRIVRDDRDRGISPARTLEQWPSVRRGEDRNIFPFQENANAMFNSHLFYELAALKPLIERLLTPLTGNEPCSAEAVSLLNILDFFEPLEELSLVPNNSILREFIGDCVFHESC